MHLMLGGMAPTTAVTMNPMEPPQPEHPLENALQGLLQLQSIADAQGAFVEPGSRVAAPKGPPRTAKPGAGAKTTSASVASKRRQAPPPPNDGAVVEGQPLSQQEGQQEREGAPATISHAPVPSAPVTAAGYGPPPHRQAWQHQQPLARGRPSGPVTTGPEPQACASNTPGVRVMRPVIRPPPPQHQTSSQLLHLPDQPLQQMRGGSRGGYGAAIPLPAAAGRSRSASPPSSTTTSSPPPYHMFHQGPVGASGGMMQQQQQRGSGARLAPALTAGGMRMGTSSVHGAMGPGSPSPGSAPAGRPAGTGGASSSGGRAMGHKPVVPQQQEQSLDAPLAMPPRPVAKPGPGKPAPPPPPSAVDLYLHQQQSHLGGEMRPPPPQARRGPWPPGPPTMGAPAAPHGALAPSAAPHRSPPFSYPPAPRPALGQARGPPAPVAGARAPTQPLSSFKRTVGPGAASPAASPYVPSRSPGAAPAPPSTHHVQKQKPQPSPAPVAAGPRLQQQSSKAAPHHQVVVSDFPQSGSPAAHRPHPVQQQQQQSPQHTYNNPPTRPRQPTQHQPQQQQPQYHYQQYDASFQPQQSPHVHHPQQQQERPQKMIRGSQGPAPVAAPRGVVRPSATPAPQHQQQQFAYPHHHHHHHHAQAPPQHHAHLHAPDELGRGGPAVYGSMSRKRPAPEPSMEELYDDGSADGQQQPPEEEGGQEEEQPGDEDYDQQQQGVPVGCDYAPMDHSGFPQYHAHHHHHHHHHHQHSPMYQEEVGYADEMVGSSSGLSDQGSEDMMLGQHLDYRGGMVDEGDYYDGELDDFQAQTLLVSIPTDSLDPATVIGSDPAQAKRLALAASNRASVSQDDHNLLISQEVMLVPSQVASPAILSQNQETRIKNLEKIPPAVVKALEAKLSTIPCWDVRITKEKLQQLGGIILVDSSPVLMQGEQSKGVTNYAPKNFHIKCQHCTKNFHGKNALRNFELHAIFWELCKAHPAHPDRREEATATAGGSGEDGGKAGSSEGAVATAAAKFEMEHRQVYPCNSVSRDVVVFMEAKKPVLCNNQKKVWKLQGNLHHDTSLFQGRAWLQIPSGQSWESCKLADPISLQRFLCCRANKTLEQYETLRAHVFTWHDSGVFTSCSTCNRVYQNTRAFLGHGCIRKSHGKDEQLVASTVEQLLSLVDCSPDLARVFFQMQALSAARKQEVFDRVGKRLRAPVGSNS